MKIKVLISLFVGLNLIGCGLPSRLRTNSIIQDITKFRDAEQIYKDKYGNGSYASVNELIDKGLLETRFADLEEHGYIYCSPLRQTDFRVSILTKRENTFYGQRTQLDGGR